MSRTAEFEPLRGYLFSLAYRMLGDAGEAEDVVQEAFLRWQAVEDEVESPKAFLSKVTTRLCIDQLRSARSRRETYVGPWLPEPVATDVLQDPAEAAERADSLSLAFLVVLETLSPVERAVFLLREIFGYGYAEIADIVGITAVNARQIARRAKSHIESRRPRFETSPERRDALMYGFLEACAGGDLERLTALLAEDAVLYSDGGGKARAARRPIYGANKVARFLLGVLAKEPDGYVTSVVDVNGTPALALTRDGRLTTVLAVDVIEDRINAIHIVVNPDKLRRALPPGLRGPSSLADTGTPPTNS